MAIREASLFIIDAKKTFNAAVDAGLLVIRLDAQPHKALYDFPFSKAYLIRKAVESGIAMV